MAFGHVIHIINYYMTAVVRVMYLVVTLPGLNWKIIHFTRACSVNVYTVGR